MAFVCIGYCIELSRVKTERMDTSGFWRGFFIVSYKEEEKKVACSLTSNCQRRGPKNRWSSSLWMENIWRKKNTHKLLYSFMHLKLARNYPTVSPHSFSLLRPKIFYDNFDRKNSESRWLLTLSPDYGWLMIIVAAESKWLLEHMYSICELE